MIAFTDISNRSVFLGAQRPGSSDEVAMFPRRLRGTGTLLQPTAYTVARGAVVDPPRVGPQLRRAAAPLLVDAIVYCNR